FDGDTFERGFFAEWYATTSNYWAHDVSLLVTPGSFDDRLTRGGPIVRTPLFWSADATVDTDSRKKLSGRVNVHSEGARDGSYLRVLVLRLNARPLPNLQLSVASVLRRGHTATQYVAASDDASATATFGRRYVFAHLDQHSLELDTRVDWTVTPKL